MKGRNGNLEEEVVGLDVGMNDVEGVKRLHQAQHLDEEVDGHGLDTKLHHARRLKKKNKKN